MINPVRVSVCMAVFNGERYIRQQIESVLNQLNDDDELLIQDDISTDNTVKIIEGYTVDKRIKFYQNKKKMGVVKNFENVLMRANGRFIFLSDQDDVWLPNKIAICLIALNTYQLVVSDCFVVDQDLKEIHNSFFSYRRSGPGVFKNLWKNSFLGCCIAFRRELLAYSLPFPESIPMHDMWLGLVTQSYGSVSFLNDKLILYRRHSLAVSSTAGVSKFSLIKKIQLRAVLLTLLLQRLLTLKLRKLLKKVI